MPDTQLPAFVRGALLDSTITDSSGCLSKNSSAAVYIYAGSLARQANKVSAATGAYHYRVLVPQKVPLQIGSFHGCRFAEALSGSNVPVSAIQGESAGTTMTAR